MLNIGYIHTSVQLGKLFLGFILDVFDSERQVGGRRISHGVEYLQTCLEMYA